jgi:hypothetical protein
MLLHGSLQLNHLVLVHFVHLELDFAVLRHKYLRWPRILSVGVVLDAIFTTDELRAFALCVVGEVHATRYAFVLVSFVMRLMLTHVDLLGDGVMQLCGLQGIGSDNLNLSKVLATLVDQLLSLNELARILRHHRDGFTVVILIVSSLVLI